MFFFFTALDPDSSGDKSRRSRGRRVVTSVLWSIVQNETISCFSLTLKRRMFWGRRSATLSFNSVDLNFLRTEALSFYKVPFVVCFCIRLLLSQDRLPFVQCTTEAGCAPPHLLLRPALPVALSSPPDSGAQENDPSS